MFNKNIKYLRESKGWSQEELANKLGYKSFTTIAKWESGASEPTLKILKELSKIFNIRINDLVNSDLSNSGNEYYLDPDVAEIAQELKDNADMRVLFDASRDISKEDMELVVSFIERLKK